MMTGSVIVGSADVGLIVCTPVPGMRKVMVSAPGLLLANVMASRSEVRLSFGFVSSAAVVTTSGLANTWLNSLVSFVLVSVAVAVTIAARAVLVKLIGALPLASVVTFTKPRKRCPSPKLLGSGTSLSKNSMRKLELAVLL